VGPMRLSISMGLHSGACDFFLVGAPHRELLLLGQAANEIIAAESSARAGEIAVSAATADCLPAEAVTGRAGRRLLRWRQARVRPAVTRTTAAAAPTPSAALLPPLLDAHLGGGRPDPEHRVACIAFLRLSGIDALLATAGPAETAAVLDQALTSIFAALNQHQITLLATDIDTNGCKLFLAGGVPHALEDDEGAMLLALRQVLDAGLPLPVQAGVNHGHVFVAEVGNQRRAAYSAMGDTTNTAARIAAKTPVGHIYAHPTVLDMSLTVFAVTPAPALSLKGKRAPLPVYDVGMARGRRQREGFDDLPFAGRSGEVAQLSVLIEQWRRGADVTLLVAGPPGAGKTRLVAEALAAHDLEPALWLRPEPYAAGQPYRVMHEPMRRLLALPADLKEAAAALSGIVARLSPDDAPWLPLLAEICGLAPVMTPEVADLELRFRRERLAIVLERLLSAMRLRDRVVWVDDAQWCDEATIELLDRLARTELDVPWLLVVSGRSDGIARFALPGERMTLAPMDDEDIRELVQQATEAAPLRAEDIETVVRSAGGNPLFALEIIRAARGSEPGAAIPESLEAALAARTDALDPERRRVLRCAAVLGRRFPTSLLLGVLEHLGHPVDQGVIDSLSGLLDGDADGALRFADAMVRDVTYAGTSFRFRRRVHRVAAEQLLADGDADQVADQLAVHFAQAGDLERCWHFARLAGDRAAQAFANAEAAQLYRTALEAGRRLPAVRTDDQRHLWTRLGEVYELSGRFDQAMEAYRQALTLAATDPSQRASLLVRRARAKERQGALAAAFRDLSAGLRLLDAGSGGSEAQRARLLAATAMVRLGQDRHRDALRVAVAAEAEARAAGEQAALGRALIVRELASLALEGPGDGRFLVEALQIFESLGDLPLQAEVHVNQGFRCAYAGQWRDAVTWLRSARDLYLRTGNAMGAAFPGFNLGEMLVKQRRYEEAEQALQKALRTFRATGFTEGIASAQAQRARILLARGDLAGAEATLDEVLAAFTQAGQPLVALEVQAIMTEVRLRQGDPDRGLTELDRAIAASGRDADLVRASFAAPRAKVLAALKQYREAEAELAAGLAAARQRRQPYEEAMLLRARSDLAEALQIADDADADARLRSILLQLDIRMDERQQPDTDR
jgi:tetratricopeptide (TPR) repeat protein/class 3 adenylate cyclase